MNAAHLILAYALASGALYSGLMPLWEGFDELYHYGYVQHIAHQAAFPRIGQTTLSLELWNSLDFVPVSHYLQPHLQHRTTSFEDYFRLTDEERAQRRRSLDAMPRALASEPSPRANYEAMQPPVTYLLLAPFERMLSATPLATRVFLLRLLLSVVSIVLLWIGARGLAARLGVDPRMEAAALLMIFSCQMTYAATCRIANDGLLGAWLPFFVLAAIDSWSQPTVARAAWCGLLLAIGLLIKSSVLILIPLAFVSVLHRRNVLALLASTAAVFLGVAGPWYARNLTLYHSLSANLEGASGVNAHSLLQAAIAFPWRRSLAYMAHACLWTGNNSFTAFSAHTVNAILLLALASLVLYVFRARACAPELITLGAIGLYGVGLIAISIAFFISSHGAVIAPMPWYMPALCALVLMIVALGLGRYARAGRWIAIVNVWLWIYVAATTWIAKLIPRYAGFTEARATPRQLLAWYLRGAAHRHSVLGNISPAPLAWLTVLFWTMLALLVASSVVISRGLRR